MLQLPSSGVIHSFFKLTFQPGTSLFSPGCLLAHFLVPSHICRGHTVGAKPMLAGVARVPAVLVFGVLHAFELVGPPPDLAQKTALVPLVCNPLCSAELLHLPWACFAPLLSSLDECLFFLLCCIRCCLLFLLSCLGSCLLGCLCFVFCCLGCGFLFLLFLFSS